MAMTDPIADFLTRIRNAIRAAHETVEIPSSKLKSEVARILAEQGYIDSFAVVAAPEGGAGELIQIRLKYTDDRRSEEHTSELQSRQYLVCRLLLEKKKK